MSPDETKAIIQAHILKEFLPGEAEDALTSDVGLISDGIIDSMSSLKLVAFLEETFGITVPAHQIDVDHLNTVDLIAAMVEENR